MKKIILTGGGTAGHVMPHLALLPELRARGCDIRYIGGHSGIERELAAAHGIDYYGVSAGKMRRYADARNVTDIFRVIKGFGDAARLMRRLKPDVVFSKGGFVTVPVVMAARLYGARTVVHESDITPGLANRLAIPFAHTVCASFPETLSALPPRKAVLTGTPIRPGLLTGDRRAGRTLCGFADHKPVLLLTGGSMGAAVINACAREALPALLKRFNVVHLCGKGNASGLNESGYKEFTFAGEELPHLFALADLVVSRAGANTLFELLALQKPHLLIPLSRKASRGDQIKNAESFAARGFSAVLAEEDMNPQRLTEAVHALYDRRFSYIQHMSAQPGTDGVTAVLTALGL